MNNLSIFAGLGVVLLLVACNGQNETKSEVKQQDVSVKKSSAEKIFYYTCPMEAHKNIVSEKPGKCPECGMNLVAVVQTQPDSAGFYACPMPEHIRHRFDKPGNCPECNMQLVPMHEKQVEKM
jgi:hypothetical protein